ncbi:unnamed protein product, partial [Thlaspi arvense]
RRQWLLRFPSRSDTSRYSVASGIFQINTGVSTFQRLVNTLGTPKDTPELRDKLHKTRLHIGQLVKDTSAKLKEASENDHQSGVNHKHDVYALQHIYTIDVVLDLSSGISEDMGGSLRAPRDNKVLRSRRCILSCHNSSKCAKGITLYECVSMPNVHSSNTDVIHVHSSSNIRILNSTIGVGDDCVSISSGSIDVLVSGTRCGPGHGISIGSLGKYKNEEEVKGIIVQNCTISGIRIKTWPTSPPSQANNIIFEDIMMINVSTPFIIDQDYCPSNSCNTTFVTIDGESEQHRVQKHKRLKQNRQSQSEVSRNNLAVENALAITLFTIERVLVEKVEDANKAGGLN